MLATLSFPSVVNTKILHVSIYGGHLTILLYMMQIDARKRWMYGDPHLNSEFIAGLHKFIDVAEANKVDNFMPCPCLDCRNVKEYSNSKTIQGHVLRRGFMPKYYCWTLHGERGVMMEDNEEEEDVDDNYPMFTEENGDTAMEENEEEEIGRASCRERVSSPV